MSVSLDPNVHVYKPPPGDNYLASRMISHNGVILAVALRRSEQRLFFDYTVLNFEAAADASKSAEELLDSDYWLEKAKPIYFPRELRSVGAEAVPVFSVPPIDKAGYPVKPLTQDDKLDLWRSSTLSLGEQSVEHFELLSDGRYVYLFRQSCDVEQSPEVGSVKKERLFKHKNTLLCDRFTLVGTQLARTIEVRYQRSG